MFQPRWVAFSRARSGCRRAGTRQTGDGISAPLARVLAALPGWSPVPPPGSR
ncbi:hypothetical protein SCATT_p07520 (plasmid) [Streptantibioticus cattleyicolor NRRL 8057 = DSM 46488]|uniref:Uncharacterized protein n=1 Tax=Streptantibioticus cattleyicolor (strain ATCC 35852 / DSM 46488 / JCM 4925 / NBRC 14057 / NRRL 8057) TaxID=1003195 RepID=G8XHT0_STREN|nr:hypothetical protein SCATT_p07520 [Streptantibioticus cattleyicolor NRRL 8057 = DSM 46488]